jgi:hypothetical protein
MIASRPKHEAPQCYRHVSPLGRSSYEKAYIRYPDFPNKTATRAAGCKDICSKWITGQKLRQNVRKALARHQRTKHLCNDEYGLRMEILQYYTAF